MGSSIGLQSFFEPDDPSFMSANNTIKVDHRVLVSALARAMGLAGGIVDHHRERVACLALRLGAGLHFTSRSMNDLFTAALFHDIGSPEAGECAARPRSGPEQTGEAVRRSADRLGEIRTLNRAASMIRLCRQPWSEMNADTIQPDIAAAANLIFLADRIDEAIDWSRDTLLSREKAASEIVRHEGALFNPEAVRALKEKGRAETFWLDLSAHHLPSALARLTPDEPVWLDLDQVEELTGIFADMVDEKNLHTRHHARRVSGLCRFFALRLGFSDLTVKKLSLAGLIHDLGKFGVPDEILAKPGALTAEEFEIVKRHPYETYYIFSGISGLEDIRDWAACHHERMDGSGYPFHYRNDHFTTEHIVVILSEILQSLIQDLPGRPALSREQVLDIMGHMTTQHHMYQPVMDVIRENFDRVEAVASGRETAD